MRHPGWKSALVLAGMFGAVSLGIAGPIGREVAIPRHLQDGEEFYLPIPELIQYGQKLFTAFWTVQDGAGRPLSKGTGAPLSDMASPLTFPRNFNRLSGPDSNSCSGCHNLPRPGGGGDIVSKVFVAGQRFDFLTFDHADGMPLRGSMDERGDDATLLSAADPRKTIGMFGSGFIEMLARQMTADLQRIRDGIPPGGASALVSKGVSFGVLARTPDGRWDVSRVEGLPPQSLQSNGPDDAPSLILRPYSQAGATVSLREFTLNAFNQHLGLQAEERFGIGTDPDGDGITNELTRADITAVTLFQATLPVPGQVLPADPEVRRAIAQGERVFRRAACSTCHIPQLPLTNRGWVYTEPNPYNPPGTLQPGEAHRLSVDLTRDDLPQPRLKPVHGIVWVPAYSDFKLHNMCDSPTDPEREALDQNQPAGSAAFFRGNCRFLTRRLWGVANEGPYMHHGQFTTLREAILAHGGEADASRDAFHALAPEEQDALIEFLKSLQVLPADGGNGAITTVKDVSSPGESPDLQQ